VAIIATDIANGQRVVFRSGPLTQAMRASMSVPGLMAPAEVGGRKLVDGGLVDNLPVDEVRSLCQPDVVIAVNVGSPLLKAEEVGSLLSVTGQMVNILTEQNVQRSIASLKPQDIYLRPTSMASPPPTSNAMKKRPSAAAPRPPLATARLQALSLPPEAFAQWRQRFEQASRVPPRVDAIEIAQLRRVSPEVIRRHLRQRPGEPARHHAAGPRPGAHLRRRRLRGRGLPAADRGQPPRAAHRADREVLGPRLPAPGPGAEQHAEPGRQLFAARRLAPHLAQRLGGEMLAVGELGDSNGAAVEWFQPLDNLVAVVRRRHAGATGASGWTCLPATTASPST
jgi:NTE family protein